MTRTFDAAAAIADERVLARARVLLSIASLVAILLDPTEPSRYAIAAYGLLLLYIAGGVWLVLTLRNRLLRWPPWAPFATHVVDILWLAVLTSVTGASNSPLFPFLTFVVLAAAYRWDFAETIATTGALSVLLFAQAFALVSWIPSDPDLRFELNRFIVRAAYMMIAGVLLAYLASYQKQLRLESTVLARLLSRLRSETGLNTALDIAAHELLLTFGARSLAIAVRESHTGESFAWVLSSPEQVELRRVTLPSGEDRRYLFDAAPAFALTKHDDVVHMTLAVDAAGSAIPTGDAALLQELSTSFTHAVAATMSFQDEWSGRVFLFDPRPRQRGLTGLRLLYRVLANIAPALNSIYLIRRLRSRAEAAERARLARDLHDTSIQSLIGVEMELLALSRRAADATMRGAIAGIHLRLREEIQALRNLMAPLSGPGTDATAVTQRLTETLARFQIDTGIRARFLSVAAVSVPPRLGHELLLLVRAALSNVKRHSRATSVDVALERDGEGWLLVIEDNGSGFRDTGRFANLLPARAPRSMRERVSALGGQLVVEPMDGPGVRLEIRLPPLVVPA